MAISILVVEDSPHKRIKLTDQIRDRIPDVLITEACSYTTGCRAIESGSFALAIIDMTLPTYDRSDSEPGGRVRTFGGREIARRLVRNGNFNTPILFVTQYRSFSDKERSYTFHSLKDELRAELSNSFFGMIFFDSSESSWRNELSRHLSGIE